MIFSDFLKISLLLFITSTKCDAENLYGILNYQTSTEYWQFKGSAIPYKNKTKLVPPLGNKTSLIEMKEPVKSEHAWEIYLTLSITTKQDVAEAKKNMDYAQGVGIWLSKNEFVDKKLEDVYEPNFFGYKDTFSGVGIVIQPQQGEEDDLIAGAINYGYEPVNTMQFMQKNCKFKLYGDSQIPIKIASVGGGVMIYTKADNSDKWDLCFGMSDTGFLWEFYFKISAQTAVDNTFTYDITELKIFSDLKNEKLQEFLENQTDYEISGQDLLRKGEAAQNETQYNDTETLKQTYLIQLDQKKKLKQIFNLNQRSNLHIRNIDNNAITGQEVKASEMYFEKILEELDVTKKKLLIFQNNTDVHYESLIMAAKEKLEILSKNAKPLELRIDSLFYTVSNQLSDFQTILETQLKEVNIETQKNQKQLLDQHSKIVNQVHKNSAILEDIAENQGNSSIAIIVALLLVLGVVIFMCVRLGYAKPDEWKGIVQYQ